MPKKTKTVEPPPNTVELVSARISLSTISTAIIGRIKSVTVTDAAGFLQADLWLKDIRTARAAIVARVDKILKPLNESRKAALELKHELDNPLEKLEAGIRRSMADYTLLEAAAIRERDRKAEEESSHLRLEAQKAAEREQNAKTQALRDRLAAKRAELQAQADEIQVQQLLVPEPVKAAHSSTRPVRKVRVRSVLALMTAICDPEWDIPMDVVDINMAKLNAYHKANRETVESWPGVDGYDDTVIVGDRR